MRPTTAGLGRLTGWPRQEGKVLPGRLLYPSAGVDARHVRPSLLSRADLITSKGTDNPQAVMQLVLS